MSSTNEPVDAKPTATEETRVTSETLCAFTADLDIPGETGRQARIFVAWFACLVLAVAMSSIVGAHVSLDDEGTARATDELQRARWAKARVALLVGLLLPSLLTVVVNRRHRRGGAHARGIVVDVTRGGELRIWGRGYGSRVALAGADVSERLVDVYAGRLGAWRQRRLRVRAASLAPGAREIELATPATARDVEEGLRVEGGEGDCVEVERADYDEIRARVLEASRKA